MVGLDNKPQIGPTLTNRNQKTEFMWIETGLRFIEPKPQF